MKMCGDSFSGLIRIRGLVGMLWAVRGVGGHLGCAVV